VGGIISLFMIFFYFWVRTIAITVDINEPVKQATVLVEQHHDPILKQTNAAPGLTPRVVRDGSGDADATQNNNFVSDEATIEL